MTLRRRIAAPVALCGVLAQALLAPLVTGTTPAAVAANHVAAQPASLHSHAHVAAALLAPADTVTATDTAPPASTPTDVPADTAAPTPAPTDASMVSATPTTAPTLPAPTPTLGTLPTTTPTPAGPTDTATVTATTPPQDVPTPTTTGPSLTPPATAVASATPTTVTDSSVPETTTGSQAAVPLDFEANRGETSGNVDFLAHAGGATLFLTGQQAVLALPEQQPMTTTVENILTGTAPITTDVVRFGFTSGSPQVSGLDPLTATADYLTGSDPAQWHTGVPTYGQVAYTGVAPGVDLTYQGTQDQLEYHYRLAPGADVGAVTITVTGTQGLSLDQAGNLVLHTAIGDLVQSKPVAYQESNGQQTPVDVQYVLPGPNTVGFAAGSYDASQPLIIDPVLSWATYMSGSANDRGQGVAVDRQGNIYLTGQTASSNFPVTNAYTTTFSGGGNDAYVMKLSPDGHTRLYSTYLGGSGDDYGYGIAVNGSGNAYVTGLTWSTNFPTTPNAFQPSSGSPGLDDAYVTELSADGRSLVYSSYLGGLSYDLGRSIALDPQGDAYVVGIHYTTYDTQNSFFPTTANAFQPSPAGGSEDAFLSKVSPDGHTLLYSTLLGGNGTDEAYGVAADAHGNAYVAGMTSSTNFPITPNPAVPVVQRTYGGGASDAFVTKLNTNASGSASLVYSTYLGGSGADQANGIAVDDSGAHVVGQTSSTNFPTNNAWQPTYGGGSSDAFVAQINVNDNSLLYSSFLGGSGADYGNGIALCGQGCTYVTGQTWSSNFITTTDALQSAVGGAFSAFATELDMGHGGSSSLLYSSYLGGTNGESVGYGIAVDGAGNTYVTGFTHATDLPGTSGTVQPSPVPSGGEDAFVAKMSATSDCPVGFDCPDIGNPALGGDQLLSGSRSSGTWSVQGSGSDIWNTSDQFHYVAMDALGDGSISARIVAQTNTGTYAKAGLMYRASEDPAAPYYDAVMTPNGGGLLQVQYRSTQNGTAADAVDVPIPTLPVYLRITRSGTTFTAYTSGDGIAWSAVAGSTQNVGAIAGTALAGLAVDSLQCRRHEHGHLRQRHDQHLPARLGLHRPRQPGFGGRPGAAGRPVRQRLREQRQRARRRVRHREHK